MADAQKAEGGAELSGRCSSWTEELSGVPQGSVLGLTLFLLFINDLDGAARLVSVLRKFADDSKLGQKAITEDRAALQEVLDKLCKWADRYLRHGV